MVQMKSGFLELARFANKNQAEYSILADLQKKCEGKIFLLQLSKLEVIKEVYSDVIKYINQEYKSFRLDKFILDSNGNIAHETIKNVAGSSLENEALYNMALEYSNADNYVLVKGKNTIILMHNGGFDQNFGNVFANKQKMLENEKNKKNIDQLDWVFDEFQIQRKYLGCEYVVSKKVSDNVDEQILRNSLIEFLREQTNLHIVQELCTTKTNDEESVDIGVIDSDSRVAIIEVKFFVKKGLFENPEKKAYSKKRFLDGYKQLNKYCVHLKEDNYDLHSAFLYMFYAHTDSREAIENSGKEYLKKYMALGEQNEHSEKFVNHYKETICDNMLNIKYID